MNAQLRPVPSISQSLANTPNVTVGMTTLQGFELAQRAAKCLASSSLVPREYQGNLSNCIIALNMAQRIGADPLQVMQSLYLVHGRPTWSAQFLIATFNQCGRFQSIRYEWRGKKGDKDWGCRAYALEKSSGERIESAWIDWALVESEGWNKRSGNKWLSMPEQMFMYRSAAWLVRAYAPELSMGLQTSEEIHDVFDAAEVGPGTYEVAQESAVEVFEAIKPAVDVETGEIAEAVAAE